MIFFQWLVGADKDILQEISDSEKKKITSIGSLVLLPAVVGFFSMMYFISMKTDKFLLCFLAGVFWFLFLALVDRAVVCTMLKTKFTKTWVYCASALARIIFSIIIGVAISHPMLLSFFDDSIQEHIVKVQNVEVDDEEAKYLESISVLKERRNDLEIERRCKQNLLTAELSGVELITDCGVSSGRIGDSYRSHELRTQIHILDAEIKQETESINQTIAKYEASKQSRINDIKKYKSTDYLSRVSALSKLQDSDIGGKQIVTVQYFIMLVLVLIDILPVLMKIFTPKGEYELIYDARLFKIASLKEAETKAAIFYSKTILPFSLEAEYKHKNKLNELESIWKTALSAIELSEKARQEYYQHCDRVLQCLSITKDKEHIDELNARLQEYRKTYLDACSQCGNHITTYIKTI